MLTVPEAQARLLDALVPLPAAEVPLAEALGLTLAEIAAADRDTPAADRSAMDGFAVRAADCALAGRALTLTGEVRAGQDPGHVTVGAGEAARIFTGASIPRGADAVVMLEVAPEDRAAGTVLVTERVEAGQHIRRRGEDSCAGKTVVAAGARIRPAEIAALAAIGRTQVSVVRAPRVAVISTGDEIVPLDAVPASHQLRNSNAAMLIAQLAAMRIPARDLGIAADATGALDALVADGLAGDVLILSGGVSVGAYDLVGEALQRAGCEVLFHQVAMRPGKPILAANRAGCLVLGLPGNPVSAFTGFHVFAVPALRRLMGDPHPVAAAIRATLEVPLRRRPGRLTYHLAQVRWQDGTPLVSPVASSSSGDVFSLAGANSFIVAEGSDAPIRAGAAVDVLLWGQVF